MTTPAKTQLKQIEQKLLWLACWTIHNANHLREKSPDGLKVGGHQASCASMAFQYARTWGDRWRGGVSSYHYP